MRAERFKINPDLILLGLFAVTLFVIKLVWLPESLIEWDEVQFALGVDHFDIWLHQPHPPGFPVWIFIGKICRWFFPAKPAADLLLGAGAFFSSFIALPIYQLTLAIGRRKATALVTALLFPLVPTVLFYGSSAFTTVPSLFFAVYGIFFYTRTSVRALIAGGVCLGLALGVRPYMGFALFPVWAWALFAAMRGQAVRERIRVAFLFILPLLLTVALWYIPMIMETGGFANWLAYLLRHTRGVARNVPGFWERVGYLFDPDCFLWKAWGPRYLSILLTTAATFGLVGFYRSLQERRVFFAFLLLGLLINCLLIHMVKHLRYGIPLLLAAVIGLAFILTWVRPRALACVGGLLLVLSWLGFVGPVMLQRALTPSPLDQALGCLDRLLAVSERPVVWFESLPFAPHLKYAEKGRNVKYQNLQRYLQESRVSRFPHQSFVPADFNREGASRALVLHSGFSSQIAEDSVLGFKVSAFYTWSDERIRWFLQWGGRYFSADMSWAQIIPGLGWYGLEGQGPGAQRWIGERAESYFYCAASALAGQPRLLVHYVISDQLPDNRLRLLLNGQSLLISPPSSNGELQIINLLLPFRHLRAGWNQLTMISEQTFIPPGPGGGRRLGILVKKIEINGLDGPTQLPESPTRS